MARADVSIGEALDVLAAAAGDDVDEQLQRAELSSEPVRRQLASCDPDVLALYERLVVAREGLRAFVRACLLEQSVEWFAAGRRAEDLVDRAQQLVERIR